MFIRLLIFLRTWPIKGTKNIILSDVHVDYKGYDPVYGVVKKYIKAFRPDVTYLLGDFANCTALSPYLKGQYCETTHDEELKIVDRELTFIEENSKKVVWLEGNHEFWVPKYEKKNHEIAGSLSFEKNLGLKKRGIEWVPHNVPYKVGHLYLLHGMYIQEYHAKRHLMKFGCSVVYGHTHISQQYTNNQVMQRTHKAWGLGCLCNKKPDYLKGAEGSWNHEFAKLYVASNGEFNLYPIDVVNNRFYIDGKRYN